MTAVPFEHLSIEELNHQHSPSRSAKDFLAVLQRHEAETTARDTDAVTTVTRNIAWGPGARQQLDIYEPAGTPVQPRPCVIHVHGGFWQEGSKAGSGFASSTMNDAGWTLVGAGYTLAPDATLRDIVEEIAAVVHWVRMHAEEHQIDPARIALSGHSAGGHLGAALLAGLDTGDAVHSLAGLVLISGVYDLAPVVASYVNDVVAMDADDVVALSPIRSVPVADVPVRLVVGADEPDTFNEQTHALHTAWSSSLTSLSLQRVAGRDHFDILDELADPESATFGFLSDLFSPEA